MKAFQFKIMVDQAKPPIWRRITIPQEASFDLLHRTIQALFGLDDYHMHDFTIPSKDITIYDVNEDDIYFRSCFTLPGKTRLDQVIEENNKIKYWYDFGDDWKMTITTEKIVEQEQNYPVLLKAKGNNLIEDVGGIWVYNDISEIATDEQHPKHKKTKKWLKSLKKYNFDFEKTKKLIEHINCSSTEIAPKSMRETTIEKYLNDLSMILDRNIVNTCITCRIEEKEMHIWLHTRNNQFIVITENKEDINRLWNTKMDHTMVITWYFTGYSIRYEEDEEIVLSEYHEAGSTRLINETDEVFLEKLLKQLMDMLNDSPYIILSNMPQMENNERLLCINDAYTSIDDSFAVIQKPYSVTKEDLELKNTVKGKEKLEISFFPTMILDKGDDIYYCILVKGIKFDGYELITSLMFDDAYTQVVNYMKEYISQRGRPKKISSEDESLIEYLKPLCEALGIRIVREKMEYNYELLTEKVFLELNPLNEEEVAILEKIGYMKDEEMVMDYLETLSDDLHDRIMIRLMC